MIGSEKQVYDVSKIQSRILMCTSTITFIPIYIAYRRSLFFYALTSTGTCLCSILYWYHPVHGWRRNLDLLYAKYSFLVYFISGVVYCPWGAPILIFYINASFIVLFYLMTMVFPRQWIYFHVLFHLLSIVTKCHIIKYMGEPTVPP